jgi:deuterolysin
MHASQCSDSTSGLCSRDGYIAYTDPNTNVITYCDIFYTSLTSLSSECGRQDQANTVVHETTHCPGVYSPYTLDYAYGQAVSDLSGEEAVRNADTYRMYAGGELNPSEFWDESANFHIAIHGGCDN